MILLIFLINLSTALADNPDEATLWDFLDKTEEKRISAPAATEPLNPPELSEEAKEEHADEDSFLLLSDRNSLVSFYQDPLKALQADKFHLSKVDRRDFDIPLHINAAVIRWMEYFTGRGRKHYKRYLQRSTKYTPMMKRKLKKAGLPQDMIYLSMIESGFTTHAYSSAAASGLWQFIRSTGREHGLRVDWWIDERRDPELSTDAAIVFLGRLNRKFGHWYLAWAAYNGGPGRVQRAIKKYKRKDFWELVELNAFPRETDNYVPKIIAAAIIGKYPERYGFKNIKYQKPLQSVATQVGPNIGVDVLAKCAGISQSKFRELNPKILQWALPSGPKKITVRVPAKESFHKKLAKVPKPKRVTFRRHKVKKGESLGKISTRYKVSIKSIQKHNKLRNANRLRVGQTLIIPMAGMPYRASSSYVSTRRSSSRKSKKRYSSKNRYHTIKKGEALSSIARKNKISLQELKRWNGITNAHKIKAGQKLKLFPSTSKKSRKSYKKPKTRWKTHTVRKGESLSRIAAKYGCSIKEVKKWNRLKSSRIQVGQKLKIQK